MSGFHFKFKVNQSFLRYPGHPITIPRGEVDYKLLESELLHQGEFVVIFPRGERLTAKMGHGDAGYGPYYQLQFRGENRVASVCRAWNRLVCRACQVAPEELCDSRTSCALTTRHMGTRATCRRLLRT
jgi:hypothetical protein